MSSVAEPASGATYKIIRELGARFQSSYAAIREPRDLVVLHRFALAGRTRGAGVVEVESAETLAALVTEADTVAQNWHPNVARVRNVDVYSGEQVAIATELVDGATLEDLTRIAQARSTSRVVDELPLPVVVRVILDVLAGLHALHALRDRTNRRLGVVHGSLAPANIVVGRDGVARLVNVLRPRGTRLTPASEALGYAAPELLEGDPLDGRADVYSVGVVLWEALTGRRLWAETSPERLRARQRAEDIPSPPAVTTFGLEHLPAIALRALSFDPSRRYRSAADMASELRKPRDAQIASGTVVAAAVAALDGDRIRGRRARLDPASSGARPRPTDAQIEAHLAALEPVETGPDTRSYDGGGHAAPTPPGGMPAARPTVPPAVDDDAWDSPQVVVAPLPPPPPPPPPRPVIPVPRVEERMSALPTRPAAFSVHMPESVGLIPTAAYAPALPEAVAPPAPELARPTRPSSTTSVVSEIDDEPGPAPAPPRRRRRAAAVLAALLLVVVVVIAGVRSLTAPPPPKLSFSTAPTGLPSSAILTTSAAVPFPSALPVEIAPAPAAPLIEPTAVPVATSPPAPPPVNVRTKPKRYEPLGI